MNKAKSCKIIILVLAFVLSLVAAVALIAPAKDNVAFAAEQVSVTESDASKYFTGVSGVKFKDDAVVATVKDGDVVSVKNKLVGNGLGFEFSGLEKVKVLTVTLTGDSYIVTGNKNAEGGFDKEIKNVLVIDFAESKATFNGKEVSFTLSGNLNVAFGVKDDALTASVEGTDANELYSSDAYYRLSNDEKVIVSASFEFALKEGNESAEVKLLSVAQENDENKLQKFVVTEGKIDCALPAIVTGGDFVFNSDNTVSVYNGYRYTASFKAYSVLGGITSSDLYISADGEGIWLQNAVKPKEIQFNKKGANAFNVVYKNGDEEKVVGTYSVTVIDKEDDVNAPVYNTLAFADRESNPAWESFTAALKEATMKDYGDDGKHSVRLGEKVTLPSMKSLVKDDHTAYENLTHTVYYKTPSSASGSVTGWDITLGEAGKYSFWVVFTDGNGNRMDEDEFFTVNDEDANKIDLDKKYSAYYFEFTVNDDAPLYVTAKTQGTGYKNVKYTATSFKFESSSYKATYTLYYNPSSTATVGSSWNGWTAIPKASTVKSGDSTPAGFTYDQIKSIAYDGSLTFTPDRTGTYAIECVIASTASVRSASATATIVVKEKVNTVKPYDHWIENNVWSVVFLGIGTLCLIAIIVLLCIKPKDVANESTGEEIKRK